MLPFRIPLEAWVDAFVDDVLRDRLGPFFDVVADSLGAVLGWVSWLLESPPAPVLIGVLVLVALLLAGWRVSLFTLLGLLLIENLELWNAFVATLGLVLTTQLLIIAVGLPLGILAASNDSVEGVVRSVLDFMQTMPAFVYLVPAVILFGIGTVPGLVATFVFALPPLIRLTNLGIRQVPRELIEASDAFGSTPLQKLVKVQLPVALPTVMAGLNQSIMLNLSMVVIAALIGARGLGQGIVAAVQRLQTGQGFASGLAVVILAIMLDRMTSGFAQRAGKRQKG